MEHMTKQLKFSGYERHEAREVITCGYIGWNRKHQRRAEDGLDFYRSAKSTLVGRNRKKLMEKTTWYKEKKRKSNEEEDKEDEEMKKMSKHRFEGLNAKDPKSKSMKIKTEENVNQRPAIGVIFVPFTWGSELAKDVREVEAMMKAISGWHFKVVERSGDSLVDILHKADPWAGQDCLRNSCMLCKTKAKTGKLLTQDCTKRNVIYETWCMSCYEEDKAKIEEEFGEDVKVMKKRIEEIKLHKYVGESSRSVFERAWEHENSRNKLHTDSHMLKHILDKHSDKNMKEIEFGIKVLKYMRTSHNWILESVIIQQENKGHHILNSKSEYNRCSLPRLTAKMGDKEIGRYKKELEEEKRKDEELGNRIKELRKEQNKTRMSDLEPVKQPAEKKRKLDDERWKSVRQDIAKPAEKRTDRQEMSEQCKKRARQDIRSFMKKPEPETLEACMPDGGGREDEVAEVKGGPAQPKGDEEPAAPKESDENDLEASAPGKVQGDEVQGHEHEGVEEDEGGRPAQPKGDEEQAAPQEDHDVVQDSEAQGVQDSNRLGDEEVGAASPA